MRWNATLLSAMCVVASGVFSTAACGDLIPWLTDLEQAKRDAYAENRLVLVHFWSPDCAPCKRLEHYVFNDPDFVRRLMDDYIPVKVNARENNALAYQHNVTRWPYDVILSPNGQAVFKMVSPQDSKEYLRTLQAVSQNHLRLSASGPSRDPNPGRQTRSTQARHELPNQPRFQTASHSSLSPNQPQQGMPNAGQPFANDLSTSYAPPAWNQSAIGGPGNPMGDNRVIINQYTMNRNTPTANTAAGQQTGAVPGSQSLPPHYAGAVNAEPSYDRPAPDLRQNQSPQYGYEAPRYGQPEAGVNTNMQAPNAPAQSPGYQVPMQQNVAAPRNIPTEQIPSQQNVSNSPSTHGPSSPPGSAPATDQQTMGLDGYCPVSLVQQNRWNKGDRRWGAVHRGRTYLFATQGSQQAFLADPDRYSPVLSGADAVHFQATGQHLEGKRSHGVVYRDRIYLFASEDSLQRFWKDPEPFARMVQDIVRTASRRR